MPRLDFRAWVGLLAVLVLGGSGAGCKEGRVGADGAIATGLQSFDVVAVLDRSDQQLLPPVCHISWGW